MVGDCSVAIEAGRNSVLQIIFMKAGFDIGQRHERCDAMTHLYRLQHYYNHVTDQKSPKSTNGHKSYGVTSTS